jgi:release factor glutamine methyltransferase
MNKDNTVNDLVQYIRTELREIYPIQEINSLTNIIFQHATPLKKSHQLHMHPQKKLEPDQCQHIKDITKQLKTGKPIQQILQETEFYDLRIKITPEALIPRQETEELVDWMIHELSGQTCRILDVGTGTGCIALALAKNLGNARVSALDYSDRILRLARENAGINQANIHLIRADILKEEPPGDYHVIVSNPPYVRESEKKQLHPNVLDHEPGEALFVSDNDPLIFYRGILNYASRHLLPGGYIYFEINEALGEEMKGLLQTFGYQNIVLKKDLNGKNRMIKAQKA